MAASSLTMPPLAAPYKAPSPPTNTPPRQQPVTCILADGLCLPVSRSDFALIYDFHQVFDTSLPNVFDTTTCFCDCAQRPILNEQILEYALFVLSQRQSPSPVPHPIIASLPVAMDTIIVAHQCGADAQLLLMAADCFAIVDDDWTLPDANRCATFLDVSVVAPGIRFRYGGPPLENIFLSAINGWTSLSMEGQLSVRTSLADQPWPLYAMFKIIDFFIGSADGLLVHLQAELVLALRRMPMRDIHKILAHVLKQTTAVNSLAIQHAINIACKSRVTPMQWKAMVARAAIAADRVDMLEFVWSSQSLVPASELFFTAAAEGASQLLEAMAGCYNLTESRLPDTSINAGLAHYVAQPGINVNIDHVLACMRASPDVMLDVGRLLQVHGCNDPVVQEIVRFALLHNRACGAVPKGVAISCNDAAFKQVILQQLQQSSP